MRIHVPLVRLAAFGLAALGSAEAAKSGAVRSVRGARDGSIAEILPVTGPGLVLPGLGASARGAAGTPASAAALTSARGASSGAAALASWQPASVPPGLYLRAISMANASVGYACGELGVVLETNDAGVSWQVVLDMGFPYYFYGCQALSAQSFAVSGFQNQTGEGILRWSENGGTSFDPIVVLPGPASSVTWLDRIEFSNSTDGIVSAAWAGGVHVTQTSGRQASDWTYRQVSPNWLAGSFTFLSDERAWIAGFDMASSPDSGQSWTPLAGTGEVFDGPIAIRDNGSGVTGGGTISPAVAGWIHRTENGGHSWTASPVASLPYPVRALAMISDLKGFAVGGNVYTGVGGIWSTGDGGAQWTLELPTTNELVDLDSVRLDNDHIRVFAIGYGSQIWYTDVLEPVGSGLVADAFGFCDAQNAPCSNPYESAGCANLTGDGALLKGSGTSSVAADDLVLTAIQLPPNKLGVIFMGPAQTEFPSGNGLIVVAAGGVGLHRFPVHVASPTGVFTEGPGIAAFTAAQFPLAAQIQPGQLWRFQCYYRDPNGPCGATYNFSNGFGVVFLP